METGDEALGPIASEYAAAPRPNGVAGGADAPALGRDVASALGQRGDTPEADGALGATARWFLSEAAQGRPPSSIACERVARRFGFVGTIVVAIAYDVENPQGHGWRESLAAIPGNMPVNRFGVYSAPGVRAAAVVFGALEATLQPFPRRLDPGATLRLQGEVGPRFSAARVYVTAPDGTVNRSSPSARRFDTTITVTDRGAYQVEIMGDGATGPVIVVNVPLYVGVPEPAAIQSTLPAVTDPPAVEARLLVLLNQSRAHVGLAPVVADEELRRLALAHDEDMVRNHFFGHVSPTTGTFDDRVGRAGLRVAISGENVAQAADADAAHDHLMGSPAHRANMLGPRYTHVGIAAVADTSNGTILATLVFARRAAALTAPPTPADLQQRAQAARKTKGLDPVEVEPSLQSAAEAGIKALQAGAGPDAALEVTGDQLRRRPPRRRGSARDPMCTQLAELFELADVQDRPFLASPALRQLGLSAALVGEPGAQKLWLMSVYVGPRCHN